MKKNSNFTYFNYNIIFIYIFKYLSYFILLYIKTFDLKKKYN